MDLALGRLSWITQVGSMSSQDPDMEEAGVGDALMGQAVIAKQGRGREPRDAGSFPQLGKVRPCSVPRGPREVAALPKLAFRLRCSGSRFVLF